jgi:hypothetical protein
VLDCAGCDPPVDDPVDDEGLDDPPQPVRHATKRRSSIHLPLLRKNKGRGDTRASSNPVGAGSNLLLLVLLTVSAVVSGALPESVGGAKVQPQPLGRPVHANESEALKPFSGATDTVKDPGEACDMARVLLERVKP